MAGGGGSKMLTLESSDGHKFEVKEAIMAAASGTIRIMVEDDCAGGVIPLPQVTGRILSRVIDYCNKHYADPDAAAAAAADPFSSGDPVLDRFDGDFVGGLDQDTLFDIMVAANYLEVQRLLDLTCKTVADQIRGKTVEEMREHFHVVNDYTEEEEKAVRRENAFAFE
ncbi:SKP1-like protein 1 [Brachypodium distachyon]|uniref:SKP1-like protein n=1 Tax=Brachypodium distachyon TaxID=15368 RepID=I1HYV9_BRADI|nr:SKP1-like protein 1 [Brachypodium distachyon]KQJ94093.1 hypothetical protein BRADI_3g08440v3 [Brachypodium distachyon]|eukprot:XP_024317857.1 SKP1-like protein 1 [Brachypodium distachyon]